MFEAFVVFCTLGTQPSIDTCVDYHYSEYLRTENECQEALMFFIEVEMQYLLVPEDMYIHNVGCIDYLELPEDTI